MFAVKGGIRLRDVDLIKYVYYNYMCKNVERRGKGKLIPYWNSIVDMGKASKLILYDGDLFINNNKPRRSFAEAYIKLKDGAKLLISGTVYLNYGAMIEVHQDALVRIGSAYINSDALILAAKKIKIGKDVLISRQVIIYDSDHHMILDQEGRVSNPPKEVTIEDHVWIGVKCTILRGSCIEKGAVIAANSVVGGVIRQGTMASGNPARSYSKINWVK